MSALSYLAALKHIGISEVAGVDAGFYQGDYFAAVTEEEYSYDAAERIGFLVVGYGSCSGCDAWEGAQTAADRLEILTHLIGQVKWFGNLEALKAYLASNDPELEWYGHEEKWPVFVAKVNALTDYTVLVES